MMETRLISLPEFVEEVASRVQGQPDPMIRQTPVPTSQAPYALVIGAGFSAGSMPMVGQLLTMAVGDYFYLEPDNSSWEQPPEVQREDSSNFWLELNDGASRAGVSPFELNQDKLPADPGTAYMRLFSPEGFTAMDEMLAKPALETPETFLQQLRAVRERDAGITPAESPKQGRSFLMGFLQQIFDPGSEHGSGSSGRVPQNSANLYLAALLASQQIGHIKPFCRHVLTTNFDPLLQHALGISQILYMVTDQPEHELHPSLFQREESAIHLVYVHGSMFRRNPASSEEQLVLLAQKNAEAIAELFKTRDLIVIGHSAWDDTITRTLRCSGQSTKRLYWCGVADEPSDAIGQLLDIRGANGCYVRLTKEASAGALKGADELMRELYLHIVPPDRTRDVILDMQDWHELMRLKRLHPRMVKASTH
jgi:hypothetical protein